MSLAQLMYHWSGMRYNLCCINLRMLITKLLGASYIHRLTAVRPVRNTISVVINEGGAYDTVSNSIIVPVTGVYYLMLTVHAPVALPSRHRVMLNANTTALEDNRRQSTVFYARDHGTTDKSIMLSLATNDLLIHQFSDPPSFSMMMYSSSFSGFLLYPT
jgi:hypothetical protein